MTENIHEHRYFIVLVATIAALGGLLFGYDTGVISGAMLFIKNDFDISTLMYSFVMSAVLLGAILGSVSAGKVSDYFGRRPVIIITSIIFIGGSLLSAFAPSIIVLALSRIILGIAIGIASFTAPLYIAEVSPYRYRGALVSLNQLAITIGIVFAYIIDYSFDEFTNNWRWMLGVGVVPALILLIGMLFLPESPRWMVLKGFIHQARDVLNTIRKQTEVEQELTDIQNTANQHKEKGHWRMLLAPWLKPAIIVGFGLAFLQQMTGINTIIYYAPTIFHMAGYASDANSILATSIVGVMNVLFTVVGISFVDRIGRRPLLVIGLFAMALGMFFMGLGFKFDIAHSHLLQNIVLFSMILYIAGFASSLGIIVWLIFSEVFPLQIRGLAISLATASTWGFNFIVTFTFLLVVKAIGMGFTFWTYGILCALGIVFVYYWVPETKGVTLEYIEANLRLGKTARNLGIPLDK